MSLLSLRARILLGAFLWTIGLFAMTGVFLHAFGLDHSSSHIAMPSTARAARWAFLQHGPLTGFLGGLSMLLGFLEIRRGMSAINELRHRLAAVHKGIDARVVGSYPSEVQPLVNDVNALLDERRRQVARTVAKAGDLAHGLKTPLAVLLRKTENVRALGQEQLALEIDQEIDRMRRQIDYHLAHARSAASAASPAARASIAESADGLARTLRQLFAERRLQIETDAPADYSFRGQREDLDEMLGNLLDNACKWARSEVKLTCSREGAHIVISVDDDGPGIDPSMRRSVMQREFEQMKGRRVRASALRSFAISPKTTVDHFYSRNLRWEAHVSVLLFQPSTRHHDPNLSPATILPGTATRCLRTFG